MYITDFIPASSPSWDQWLDLTAHDFYHTAVYHRFAEERREGKAFLAVYGNRDRFLAWPYLLRSIDRENGVAGTGRVDITSVYGYSGPVSRGCEDDGDFLNDALQQFAAHWHDCGVVSVFSRLHPILRNDLLIAHANTSDRELLLEEHGRTVSIDLQSNDEEARRRYQRILRQEIDSARRHNLTTRLDENWSNLEEFVRLYHRTMQRNGASAEYYYSIDELHALRVALGPSALLMVTRLREQVAAACFLVRYRGVIHAHLEGTNSELLKFSPFKVLIDDVRRWGHDKGDSLLHFGGGRGAREDSLFQFKARFSPLRNRFFTVRWIVDPEEYESLCRERGSERGGYFPAYRAARPVAEAAW